MAPASPDRWLLLLGSNVEREANLEAAERRLEARFEVLRRSRVYESAAVGDPGGPPFLNRALLVRSLLAPAEMQRAIREIEAALGRVRGADRNAPRTIDVDVLLALDAAGDALAEPTPHRDLRRHHHAAIPAAEVAGEARLPDGTTVAAAAAALGPPPAGFRKIPAS